MARLDRRRLTIGRIMLAIALSALVLTLIVHQKAAEGLSVILGVAGTGFLLLFLFAAVLDFSLGIRCPRCGGLTMGRTSVVAFRDRFFRCSQCGVRWHRGLLRAWKDVSHREFDPIFARKRPENPWTAPPGLDDDEDLIYSKTHGTLLLNKQRRNPNPPDQWAGLDP